MLDPLLSGEDLTGARYETDLDNLGRTYYQVTDSNPANNTTTYQDSTDLVIPLGIQASYIFRCTLFVVSNSLADIKIRLKFPLSSFARVRWGDGTLAAEDDVSDLVEQGFSTSGALEAISPSGFVTTGTVLANLIVGYAQNTAHVSNTLLKLGSFVTVTRVA